MTKTMKETTDRAKTCKCVRFDDKNGFVTKFNKTNFPNELMRELYYFCVKYVEQLSRGFSPTSVAKKERFQKFQMVSQGLKLKALPEDYQSFSPKKKEETVKKIVEEVFDELAAALSHGPVQDVDMQVNNPDQIQVDEVPAAAPNPNLGNTFSNDASLQNVSWNQCDNPEGRPPPRPPVPLDLVVSIFEDLMRRASRFPGILPKLVWSEAALRSFVIQLESMEDALEDRSGTHLRSCQEEFYAPLADFSAYEVVTSLPSMEESLADEFWSNLLASVGRPEAPGTSPNLCAG